MAPPTTFRPRPANPPHNPSTPSTVNTRVTAMITEPMVPLLLIDQCNPTIVQNATNGGSSTINAIGDSGWMMYRSAAVVRPESGTLVLNTLPPPNPLLS